MDRTVHRIRVASLLVAVVLAALAGRAAAEPALSFQRAELPDRLKGGQLVAVADVTGSGHADLVVSTSTGIFVLPGDGTGKFPNARRAADNTCSLSYLWAADFNLDGKLDLVGTGVQDLFNPTTTHVAQIWLGENGGHFRRIFDFGPNFDALVRPGDFDGDGIPDLLVSRREWYAKPPYGSSIRSVLEVRRGDGQGAFAAPVETLPQAPDNVVGVVALTDLNRDGRADPVVWSSYALTLEVLLADGSGGFQSPLALTPPPRPTDLRYADDSPHIYDVKSADLNGDGLLDLLARFSYRARSTADPQYGDPREFSVIYIGDGAGRFAAPVRLAEPLAHERTVIRQAVGDLNGDGRNDVVLSGTNRFKNPGPVQGLQPATDVYLSAGDRVFTGPILSPFIGGDFTGTRSPLADLNADGILDMVTAGPSYGLQVALGDGTGTFSRQSSVGAFDEYYQPGAATGDFNGDGNADIAVANSGSFNVSVWLGDGAGGWSGPGNYPLAEHHRPMAIVAADLNGDGKLDLATAATYFRDGVNGVSILYGDGAGHFTLARTFATVAGTALVAADLDQDGTMDLAVADRYDRIVELYFDVSGATRDLPVTDPDPFPEGSEYTLPGLAVADFDGNGVPDLARSSETGSISVFLNPGAMNFGPGPFQTLRVTMAHRVDNVAAGDVNGDGLADLVAPHMEYPDGYITVALGDGKGGFGAAADYPLHGEDMPFNVAIADLNGRGQRAVVTNSAHGLKVLLADASGRLGTPSTFEQDSRIGPLLHNLPVVDLNHDGLLDIVTSYTVFWNRGACGDGHLDVNEECDDGNNATCDGCSASCHAEVGTVCGDGIVSTACGEECDAGEGNSDAPGAAACRTTCRLPGCGDGILDAGEECDDGNAVSCDGCSAHCYIDPPPVCGDAIVNTGCGEQCDDGNLEGGDGCSEACQIELIPGGGSAATDCFAEWVVVNPHNSPRYDRRGRVSATQRCHDNDPTCDFDGGTVGSCTFHLSFCVNLRDDALPRCAPAALQTCDVMRPSLRDATRSRAAARVRSQMTTTMQAMIQESYAGCSPPTEVTVPTKGLRSGRLMLMTRAQTLGRKLDADTLTFTCIP